MCVCTCFGGSSVKENKNFSKYLCEMCDLLKFNATVLIESDLDTGCG